MKSNKKTKAPAVYTANGAKAANITKVQSLRRTLMSCFLFEDNGFEDGVAIADRLAQLVKDNRPDIVAAFAIEARTEFHLRHAPLFVAREMARYKSHLPYVAEVLSTVIQRADELAEFMAMYWKGGRCPIANQVKIGLQRAFLKFDEFQLAKYNRDADIKLRDVLFMVRPKPDDLKKTAKKYTSVERNAGTKRVLTPREKIWKNLAEDTMPTPDTWEVAISACKNEKEKKAEWTRLLNENGLGGLAFLRNLRNMQELNIDKALIKDYFEKANFSKVLPFRFIAASKFAPSLESNLEKAMLAGIANEEKITGNTILLVDVSGSMDEKLSAKSDNKRLETAEALAILCREIFEDCEVYTFSNSLQEVPNRRGFALRDAIEKLNDKGGTDLASSLRELNKKTNYDRLIVITDEQVNPGAIPTLKGTAYMINVSSARNGIGYGGKWIHIDGFSEKIIDFIREYENCSEESED